MNRFLLSFELINSPLMVICGVISALGVIAVIVWAPRRIVRTLIVGVAAGVAMYITAHVLESMDLFQGPLPVGAALWAAGGVAAAAVGIVGVCRRPWGRRVVGAVTVLTALFTAALGVNAAYGVTHNLAAILGVQALDPASLPQQDAAPDTDPATLYQRWTPPADMPKKGTVSALTGDSKIPTGQYAARDASLYLPPAALTANPPKLPLVVFMMGQPGSPDPTSLANALDGLAAKNHGLAPIAIVVDQLGDPHLDPLCIDSSKYGAVSTYINQLVPQWAVSHLNVIQDSKYHVIGGFSNGGACAALYGAQHPDVWGQLLDVSGNEFPGSEHADASTKELYGGDAAAFDAAKPAAVMAAAKPGSYNGHTAIFTWGGDDKTYGPGQQANADAAKAAGFTVLTHVVDGTGHTGEALDRGLGFGVAALAATLGLAPPAS